MLKIVHTKLDNINSNMSIKYVKSKFKDFYSSLVLIENLPYCDNNSIKKSLLT